MFHDNSTKVLALAGILIAGIFAFDLSVPLGVAGSIPYVTAVILGVRLPQARYTIGLALAASLMTVLGYAFSPSEVEEWIALVNRGLALVVIWSAALLIVQRKATENKFLETKFHLDAAIESFTDGFSVYDADDRLVLINQHILNSLPAFDEDQLLGMTFEEVLKATTDQSYHALAGHEVDAFSKRRLENFRSGKPFEYASQTGRWFELREYATPNGGIAIVRADITDRKLAGQAVRDSEAKLSGMLSIAPDAIIATDQNMRLQVFNQGAERVFGFSSAEVLGQTIDVLLPERFRQRHAGHFKAFLNDDMDSRVMSERSEIFGLRKDGSEFPAEASISKARIGNEITLTVMLHDISGRKEIEAELLAAKERAEYADRAKSEFLANMSHELRTPLNAIIGFSEMMQRETFGPLGNAQYKEYSSDIFNSGELLLSLINDILDLSKIEAGQAELNEAELETAKVVQDCLRLIEPRALAAGLKLRVESESGLAMLRADERMTKQILLNLLSNAVKFTQRGGEITISSEMATNGGLTISVTDTGIGIAPHDIPKAMSTFGQVEGALDRRFEGSGLGLPLVKSMVELHGAVLELESELGVGTRVEIRFPKERVVRRSA